MDTEDTRQWLLFMGPQIEKQTSKIQNQNHAISAIMYVYTSVLKKSIASPFFLHVTSSIVTVRCLCRTPQPPCVHSSLIDPS